MLDLVCDAEFHQKLDKVSKLFDVLLVAFVGFDVSQEDYVVGQIEKASGRIRKSIFVTSLRLCRGGSRRIPPSGLWHLASKNSSSA